MQSKGSFSDYLSVAQLCQLLPPGGKNHSRLLPYFLRNHTSCPNTQLELIHYLLLNPTQPVNLLQKLMQTQNRVKNTPDDSVPYHGNETQVSVLARHRVSPYCNMRLLVKCAQKLLRVGPKTKMDLLHQDRRRFSSCYPSLSELMDFHQAHPGCLMHNDVSNALWAQASKQTVKEAKSRVIDGWDCSKVDVGK